MSQIQSSETTKFLINITLLLLSAKSFGYLFKILKMPTVIGEILGGIILRLVLEKIAPTILASLFADKLILVFDLLGLLLLMFCSGFEITHEFNKEDRKTVITIATASIIIPFFFGWISADFFDLNRLIGSANNYHSLKIIIGIAIAITSIPVISKMFFDLEIISTKFAKVVLGIATIHDIILWMFLSIATELINSQVISSSSLYIHIGVTLLFFGFALIAVPVLIIFLQRKQLLLVPNQYEAIFTFFILFIFVCLAEYFKINIIFGAFLAGVIIKLIKLPKFNQLKSDIKGLSFALFIPIYFVIVGLKIKFADDFNLLFFFMFIVYALIIQGITVFGTARMLGHNTITSLNLAMAINTRGGPCIILATIAFNLNIINVYFFTTLILLAIITSLISGIWLRYIISKNLELYNTPRKAINRLYINL